MCLGRQLTESDNQGANRPDWLQDYGGGAYNGDAADAEQDRAEAEESRSEDSKVCQRGLQVWLAGVAANSSACSSNHSHPAVGFLGKPIKRVRVQQLHDGLVQA